MMIPIKSAQNCIKFHVTREKNRFACSIITSSDCLHIFIFHCINHLNINYQGKTKIIII